MTSQQLNHDEGVVRVYPENPHYLMYKGKPLLLITSAEHYGAVINLDFDYRSYLDELAVYDLNYTRIYPGAYIEIEGCWVENNTLAPRAERLLLPWERSQVKGCWDGGNKYDLNLWSEVYFQRLKDFISEAEKKNIVVEICFFNCQYKDNWHGCPLNANNNVQGIGPDDFNDCQTLKYPDLINIQDRYVEKIIREVNAFDNVILEICDEPTLNGTPEPLAVEWIDHLVDVVIDTEKNLPKKHLIAQQYMVGVDFTADARVPVITTQYIEQNMKQFGGVEGLNLVYHLNKPIELNETAYFPTWYEGDVIAASRAEAWEFMVGGGAAFNQLNGRFTDLDPRGKTPDNQNVLKALKNLKAFLYEFDFTKMTKDTSFMLSNAGQGALVRGISQPGEQYALYFHHSILKENGVYYIATPGTYQQTLEIDLPPGKYVANWVLPQETTTIESTEFFHNQGTKVLKSPLYHFDVALSVRRIKDEVVLLPTG